MRFWIEISSATGTRTGRIDNALYWRHTARLDRAGTFEFAIPAADAKSTLIVNQQRVFCYGLVNGVITEIGAGIVERIVTQQNGTNPAVTVVSGDDVLRELAIHEIMGSPSSPIYPGALQTDTIPDYLIGNATTPDFPANWTLGGATSTQSDIYVRFGGESIFYLLTRVAQVTGEHFRYGGSRTLTWLGPASTFAASGVLATTNADPAALDGVTTTCLITQIEEELDSHAQCNFLVVTGAGTGEVPLTLAAAENWPPGLVDDTTGTQVITWTANVGYATDGDGEEWWCERVGATYLTNRTRWAADGRLVRFAQFKDIAPLSNTNADLAAAADYLLQAAYHELRTRTTAQRAYRLAITGLETALQVGTTLAVQARSVTEDDSGTKRTYINVERDDLLILETETQIDERGIRTLGMTVATTDRWPDSSEQAVIERLNEGHASLILPQMSVSVDTTRFRESIDDSYSADFDFLLSDYVTIVNQVIFRFRVDPLRSTVKSVSGGASSSSTSDAEGAHTHTTPSHYHNTTIVDGSAFTLVANANLYTSGGIYYLGHEAGSSSHPVTTVTTGEGGTTSAAGASHSHGMTHTHTSTGVYGVYEESGANTYAYSDLEFEVNGSAATNSPAAISGGWYGMDITVDLVDAVNRPLQEANYVTVQVKAASHATKTVQVTAEIERRCTIQSIATV
jgi:hypothetical protein